MAKATAADYKKLEKHLEAERRSLEGDHKVRSQLLGDFHVVLAQVVGNEVIREMLHELVARSSLITMLYQSDRDAACSADEHAQFIAAARSGDADLAARVMLDHLTHVEAALRFDSGTQHDKDLVSALLK